MKTLFLDMDGVVSDFNAYARKILPNSLFDPNTDQSWDSNDWITLRSNPRLYRDIPKTPEADELVNFSREFCIRNEYQLLFLTAIPKDNDVHWAFYDKVLWAQKLFPDIPVMFGPHSYHKKLHCRPGDILIDDRNSNVLDWCYVGGFGILHKGDVVSTIDMLDRICR